MSQQTNDFHKDSVRTHYEVADANWGMYSPERFETIEDARKHIETDYKNHPNEYWRNRKQIVIKVTTIHTIVTEPI